MVWLDIKYEGGTSDRVSSVDMISVWLVSPCLSCLTCMIQLYILRSVLLGWLDDSPVVSVRTGFSGI